MASISQTAIDAHGYCFQLPRMGLPDVGGGWTPLRAAVGPMEACYEQLFVRHIAAPFRRYNDVPSQAMDLEYDGWFLVLPLLPSRAPPGEVDLFTVLVRRDRKSSAPAEQTVARIPDGVYAIFARHSPQKIDCLVEPEADSDPSYMETTELLRICRDPTPSQCESVLQDRPKWAESGESDKAYQAWPAIHTSLVNKDWLSQVHREVTAAGLGEPDAALIEKFYKFRPRQAPDQEGRGLEYALCRREDKYPPPDEAWKPVPLDAFPLEYMRCGVNLYRLAAGKRLLTKEEWPCKGSAAHQGARRTDG